MKEIMEETLKSWGIQIKNNAIIFIISMSVCHYLYIYLLLHQYQELLVFFL